MRTERDREIVDWLARVGAAEAGHVMRRFGLGRTKAYARLNRLVSGGLVAHRRVLDRRAGVYVATRRGLRWCERSRLGLCTVGAGALGHTRELAAVSLELEAGLVGWRVIPERELRALELDDVTLVGSVRLSGERDGTVAHRPDALVISRTGRAVAIELELTVKARRRLESICRAYARARHLDHVYYLAAPAAARAVAHAVSVLRAQDRITVMARSDVHELVRSELER